MEMTDEAVPIPSDLTLDDPDTGWKQHCIDTYVLCRGQKKPRWVGDCYACFRNCEGQKQWPFDSCYPARR